MFRFASHRLTEIISISAAGLVMLCAHDARIGDAIAPQAHAEDRAPLATISELVKHKGVEIALEKACDGISARGSFDSKKVAEEFTVVGVTVDGGDLAKVDPNYPKDYDAGFVRLIDRRPPVKLLMTMSSVLLCRTSRQDMLGYAFSVYPNYPHGRIVEADVGAKVNGAYRWSVVDVTADMQDIFSTELQFWSGAAMQHFVEALPSRR